MNVSRRTVFKWLVAALPLLDIGCAGVGTSRARQIGGVFPLLCTPYSEDGSLDCETLSKEAVVEPKATDEALVNPGMGFVHYGYSSRIWAYDTGLEPGDTLDWIPGTSVVYMRLPWSYLEPEEGVYRWDILDVKARPWIEKGKKVAFRFAVMDHTMDSIPDWAMKAGIKGRRLRYKGRPDAAEWFEPEWDDPVLLAKHEAFLRAFARRWDGNPDVAFVDVGSFGAYGEGHCPSFPGRGSLNQPGQPQPDSAREVEFNRIAKIHIDMIRRCLPNTYLVISDDFGGAMNPSPDNEIMAYARNLGIGFRDDSIFCVNPPQCWAHAGWARQFAKTLPVVVETGHHVRLCKACGGDAKVEKWFPEKILQNLVEYQASYYTVQSFPKHLWRTHAHLWTALAKRIGYRMELRKVVYPETAKAGEPVEIVSTWVNVGVAPLYAGASLTWNLLDENGVVVWSIVDPSFDFRTLEPTLEDGEKPATVKTRGWFGFTTPVPDNGNDDVLRWARLHPEFDPGKTVSLLKPGTYTLSVSVGRRDGKPEIALPLEGDPVRRIYPIGKMTILP